MQEEFAPDTTLHAPAEDAAQMPDEDAAVETTSIEYIGRWTRLVSTTNWEKGRIVAEWREVLIAAGAAAAAYSDDAWSRRVGSVTPQHTGRLRRVYQRFAAMRNEYSGLYWSHFQAALDWDDAEMWLEGAVQNRWSIAQMQGERSRTLGALVEENVEAVDFEVDEDAAAAPADLPPAANSAADPGYRVPEPQETAYEDAGAAADGSADYGSGEFEDAAAGGPGDDREDDSSPAPLRPFENLPNLPADLREAFDGFKVAIIHHRISKWQEVSRDDILATLEALRQLVLAPSEA
jgi:hypothetical protein